MSTEFRIGMSDGRNSSRVLKPPGGGHSQIFGGPEEELPKKIHQKTAISSCFDGDVKTEVEKTEVEKIEVEKTDAPEKVQDENTNGTNTTITTNGDSVEEKKNDINEVKSEGTPQRKRVPPGGFSSGGFW